MRVFPCLLSVLASLATLPLAHAQAASPAWAVDYDRLYRVDLDTRTATLIGELGSIGPQQPMADLSGLTTAVDGTLYVASDTLKGLIRVDPASGRGTWIGRFDIAANDPTAPLDFAMAASCDGGLWLASPVSRQLWRVDPGTGKATPAGNLGRDITGLAVERDDLFGIGGRGEEGWYQINRSTGQSRLIGGLGSMVDYLASASPAILADGTVLAVFNYIPPPAEKPPPDWSDLAVIDRDSGRSTILGPITGPAGLRGIGIRGFTVGPPACAATPPPIVPGGTPDAVQVPTLGNLATLLLLLGLLAAALRSLALPAARAGRD